MYTNKIKKYRKQEGMSLEEMAKKVGISTGYLCHLERGTRKNPSTKIMESISNVLGKTIVDVFFDEEKNRQ